MAAGIGGAAKPFFDKGLKPLVKEWNPAKPVKRGFPEGGDKKGCAARKEKKVKISLMGTSKNFSF